MSIRPTVVPRLRDRTRWMPWAMRMMLRRLSGAAVCGVLLLDARVLTAQSSRAASAMQRPASPPPFVAGYRTSADVAIRIYAPAGRLRLTVWARDSVSIVGTQSARATRFGGGSSTHIKIGVEPSVAGDTTLPAVDWEVFVPARARVWAKMIDGSIDVGGGAGDVARQTGEFELYTVRGTISARDVRGVLSIESIDAPVSIARASGDVRVRGSRGAVVMTDITGTMSVATVSGAVSLAGIRADGRVETIGGTIDARALSLAGKQLELQTHAGAITLMVDAQRAPQLLLSQRAGPPVREPAVKGSVQYGTLVARSFKGTIRVERTQAVP
ncbi:MAG: hypothetical protein IT353_10540 [Gemmatimonadaceae bacterium]|nr:hypothetical protein [Gemmatimonadaceae bacterium]